MGEVYEAFDPRIGRRVAIKILPRALAVDPDRVRRFQQEARAAGALSHPNLLSLFDLGEEDGVPYLVTELLTGESLRTRLRRGPLSARQAREVVQQIAEGLAAAHERGIVHRDLKPDNLFLTTDGRVKILDFGLAKLTLPDDEPGWKSRTGVVVGTAAYMAPEQVRGETADARADLFAVGAILYELLTGEPAFRRGTTIATLNAVLDEEPAHLASLGSGIPAALATLLSCCLEKDPTRRFQSAHDLAVALRSLSGSPSLPETELAIRPPPRKPLPRGPLVAVSLALALACGLALGLLLRRPAGAPPTTLRHLTRSRDDSAPALSPDGKSVVFVSQRDGRPRIWLKELTGGGETPLTAGPDRFPRFSPDGASLLFVHLSGRAGALTKMPFPGGPERTLLRDVFDADWSPDGRRIAFVRHQTLPPGIASTVLGVLVPENGQTREVARLPGRLLYQPRWSPDGSRLALAEVGGSVVVLVELTARTTRTVAPPPPRRPLSTAVWDGPHHLLVLAADGPSPGVAVAAGACRRLDVRNGRTETLFWSPNWGQHLDARGGRVVFSAGSSRQSLWEAEVAADGTAGRARWLTSAGSIDRQPAYSPDGAWVAFSSDRSGNLDIWKVAVGSGELVRLTDDPAVDWDPTFTADGQLVWSSDRHGGLRLWRAAADGSGARPFTPPALVASNPASTGAGGWIVFAGGQPGSEGLWRVRPDGSGLVRLGAGMAALPAASPDGRLVAFLRSSASDPKLASLVLLRWPGGEVGTLPLSPQSLTDLPLPGRSGFWGNDRLAYVDKDGSGRPGIFVRRLDRPEEPPIQLVGPEPPFLPESFAFSPDGRRLAVSRLELQQNLVLAELGKTE